MRGKSLVKVLLLCMVLTAIAAVCIVNVSVKANTLTVVDLASDTAWTLSIDGSSTWRSIKVPAGGWDSDEQSPIISRSSVNDYVTYKRDITIPNQSSTQVTKILFDAVNYSSEIYLNGALITSHVGVMSPFEVDLTNYVTPGSTYSLTVKAYCSKHWSTGSTTWSIPASFNYPARAGGDVYVAQGISKFVKLAVYPQVYVKDVFVRPSVTNNNLYYNVWIHNHASTSKTLALKGNLTPWNAGDSWSYSTISDTAVTVPADTVQKVTVGPITWGLGSTSYWWPNIPFSETYTAKLHNLNLTVKEGTTTLDTKTQRFGFSEYTEGPYYYKINGVRVNHISDGTTETQIWNDMYTRMPAWLPPAGGYGGCPETLKRYMRMGINTNRMCLSMPTEYIMNTADEVGFMFVNESTVDGNNQGGSIQAYQEQAVKDLAKACRNHPSCVRYSLSNEYDARTFLIDAIVTEDNTRPLVFETNSSGGQVRRVDSGAYHAYCTNHYTGYPTPATGIFMMGEYAWGGTDTGTYECIGYKAKDMRRNDVCYMAGWSWLNYWPNMMEGLSNSKHNWAQDNHADRVDGVDGWNSPIMNFAQRSFNPFLAMDNDIEYNNQSYALNWPSTVPSYSKGANISRNIEVFNGGISGSTMTLDWEARYGSSAGSLYTSGSTGSFTLNPGFHATKTISFTAPNTDTNLFVLYKSKLGSTVMYTEDRVYYKVGAPSPVPTATPVPTPIPTPITIPNGSTNFFYQLYSGSRNDFTGTVGFEFTPTQNITVTALGRAVSTSMNSSHDVKIWKVSDQSVVASGTVTTSSSTDSAGYKYVTLGSAVTLNSGTAYRIASTETSGGDKWMDLGVVSRHSSLANISCAVWVAGVAYPSTTQSTADYAYVPVTFYTGTGATATPGPTATSTPTPTPTPTPTATPGSLTNYFNQLYTGTRNNFTGVVGFEFTPSQNISVTALGRAVSTSMNSSHDVKIWKVSDQSQVAGVTVSPSSGTDTLGYKYVTLGTPVTLNSGTAYRISSSETSGGDQWMDLGTISNHSSIASISRAVWATGTGYPSSVEGVANQGYVPVTFYTGSGGGATATPTPTPTSTPTPGGNLALGKTASASSQWDANYPAGKANDGDATNSRWAAANGTGAGEWLQIDFGTNTTFNKTIITQFMNRIASYKIQYWNGASWVDAFTGGVMGAGAKTDTFTAVTGSKMRLYISTVQMDGGYNTPSTYELEVYNN